MAINLPAYRPQKVTEFFALPMSHRVSHYSRKGQTLSPIRPSQKFLNSVRAYGLPIHQIDLVSFCSTDEPTEFLTIPESLCNFPATDERGSSPLFPKRSNPLPDTTEPKVSQFPCVPMVSLYIKPTLRVFALPASRPSFTPIRTKGKPSPRYDRAKVSQIPKGSAISLRTISERVFE